MKFQQPAATALAAAGILGAALAERYQQMRMIYTDTPARAKWRNLFESAARLPADVELIVQFIKNDDTLRCMRCRPIDPDDYRDPTARYATVWDLDKEDFRRVALDSILDVRLAGQVLALPA